jgi:ribose/xylose/arabinose/galactoside ABC-type transport system permease subunit
MRENQQNNNIKIVSEYGAIIAYAIAVLFFSVFAENFINLSNILNILVQSTALGVCAFGLTFVLMTGELDLSYAGLIGLVGAVLAGMLEGGHSPIVVGVTVLAIGALVGVLNAYLVVGLGLSSFLSTAAVMFVCMGAERVYSHGTTVWIEHQGVLSIVQGKVGPIPIPIIILVLLFISFWYFQTQTKTGQYIRALGENIAAVRETGIQASRLKAAVFILAGVIFAVGGGIDTLRTGGAIVYAGKQMLLFVLAASFIGTASFKAGKANFPGTLLGSIFLVTLMNGFTLLGMEFYLVPLIQGLILLASVTMISIRRRAIEQVKF